MFGFGNWWQSLWTNSCLELYLKVLSIGFSWSTCVGFKESLCWPRWHSRNYSKIGHVSVELIANMSWRRKLYDHSCLPSRHHPNEENWKNCNLWHDERTCGAPMFGFGNWWQSLWTNGCLELYLKVLSIGFSWSTCVGFKESLCRPRCYSRNYPKIGHVSCKHVLKKKIVWSFMSTFKTSFKWRELERFKVDQD